MERIGFVEDNRKVDKAEDLGWELILFAKTGVFTLQLLHLLVHCPCSLLAAFELIQDSILLKLQIGKIDHYQVSEEPKHVWIDFRVLADSCRGEQLGDLAHDRMQPFKGVDALKEVLISNLQVLRELRCVRVTWLVGLLRL